MFFVRTQIIVRRDVIHVSLNAIHRRSEDDREIDRARRDQEAQMIGQSTKLNTSGIHPTRNDEPGQAMDIASEIVQ